MANVFDVAKYVLDQYEYGISTRKLQKLVYFSQGWTLALTPNPLFKEEFEAWRFGPVCHELYRLHRGAYSIVATDLQTGDAHNLAPLEQALIDAVIRNYGALSGDELSELTHQPGSAWHTTREHHRVSSTAGSHLVIPKEKIRKEFHSVLQGYGLEVNAYGNQSPVFAD